MQISSSNLLTSERQCRTCGLVTNNFRPKRPACRDCERAECRAYGVANREKRNARLRRWRRQNPAAAKAGDRRDRYARKYRLTVEQVRQMHVSQDGQCALCGRVKTLVVDHCHATGRVRALLCHRCNTSLGWFESNPQAWKKLAAYLDQPCHADVLLELANQGQ